MTNLASFSRGLREFGLNVKDKSKQHVRDISSEVLRDIVNGTPVDTGHAVANWHVNLGAPDGKEINDIDPGRSSTISAGENIIRNCDPHSQVIFIENNLKYISSLEDGHSAQAPSGMVEIAIMNARNRNGL